MRFQIDLPHLLALIAVAGCAQPITRAPQAVDTPSAPLGAGTILSMRTVTSPAGQEPWRALLLAGAGADDGGERQQVEFIVRADDGATLSIVQPNESDFRPGDRVIILRGARTHLARPG